MTTDSLTWGEVLAHLRDLAIAYGLALPIGWDRERASRSAGVRTFPLVSMAACGFVLMSARVLGTGPDAQSRMLQGLITATGFLAAGVVLKESSETAQGTGAVKGMTTAVSIWTIGVVGAAVGFGLYDIAVILSVAAFITLWALKPLKRSIEAHADAEGAARSTDRTE